MVWLRSDSIAIAAVLITTFFALINYLYARRRTQPQPRVYISKIRVDNPFIVRENKPPCCTFKILFRNSGDISTVIDVVIGINVCPYYVEKKKDVVHTLAPSVIHYEFTLNSGQNHTKAFTFDLIEEVKDWEDGILTIYGSYLGYKDKERKIFIFFEGKRDDKRWIPRVYIVEEDTLLGFFKRRIRVIGSWYQKRKYRFKKFKIDDYISKENHHES